MRHRHRDRLIEGKFQQGFTGDVDLLALGHDLDGGSCTRAHAGADGRAFSTADNCANDRAGSRAAAHFLGCIRATRFAREFVITGREGPSGY